MEYTVGYLNEPRPTSLDGFISGDYQVAIECTLLEREVGTCSRPGLYNNKIQISRGITVMELTHIKMAEKQSVL